MERVINLRLTSAGRLDAALAKELSLSRTLIAENIERGALELNGVSVKKPSHKVCEGDSVKGVISDPFETTVSVVPGDLDILFEDEALIALNKRQGVVVHPAPSFRGDTLVSHLLHHLQNSATFRQLSPDRPGIVHRLDRGTSGVILIAKTRAVLDALSHQFKTRAIQKTYECIVWGATEAEGSYNAPIGRDPIDRKRMSLKARQSRLSETAWKRITAFPHFSHLEVYPKTGRTHQIRVHLSAGGFPIVGDSLYARPALQKKLTLPRLLSERAAAIEQTCLHAKRLVFTHPTTHLLMTIEAPRPKSFDLVLNLITTLDR
ncbi:MAG: RluA family pseudouridine synthase [Deltaproteobacteria bacterium]|nr:RluA family pseudouridine synthase [Deltaproteobacteria bacterium]MBI3294293.1 RluA family pseudouridine synthase [Deltaproteobacteria bacterium]